MPAYAFYLHGFASTPHGRKVEQLSSLLAPDIEFNAPDLNVPSFRFLDFEAMIARAVAVAQRWKTLIPPGDPLIVHHYGPDAEAPIHRAFFDQVEKLTVDELPPPSRVTVIMGRNDASVPYDCVAGRWREWELSGRLVAGSKFVEIPGGDHRLIDFADVIAREIRAAI